MKIKMVHIGRQRSEVGFTLLELLLVLAIGALVLGGLTVTVYQLSHVTVQGQAELKAQHQLQNVASWLNRDAVSAFNATVATSVVTFTIPVYDFGQDRVAVNREVSYSYSEGTGTLTRSYGGESQIVGRNLESMQFSPAGEVSDTLLVTVTASCLGSARTSGLKFYLRASE